MKKFLLVCILLMISAFCLAGVEKESDPRLHSGGGIWGFKKSASQEAKPFRVLLVGDSVMYGYQSEVMQALNDTAHFDVWLTPWHLNSDGLRQKLRKYVSGEKYDVIHFNIGLHGWQEGRIPKGQYESLLRQYVDVLLADAGPAKLIWASTTPMMTKETPRQIDPVNNPTIVKRNAIAERVMIEKGITINDLYTPMSENLNMGVDQFHWSDEGKQLQAKAVAQAIRKALVIPSSTPVSSETLVYKKIDKKKLYLDVYRPASRVKTPVFIMVHGGGWSGGKRNGPKETLLKESLPKEGIAFVSIDYRLMRGEVSDITTGTFDRAMEDIADAYKWVMQNADEQNFDVDRIGIGGGSAGGHLSAIFVQRCDGIRYHVGICGLYDMCNIGDSIFPEKEKQIKYGLISEEDRKRASAIYNIRNNPPVTLLMHGTTDKVIEYQQAVRFGQALEKQGGTVQVELFEGMGHPFFQQSHSSDHDTVKVMVEFLKKVMFDTKR